jgi:hypothetical protein
MTSKIAIGIVATIALGLCSLAMGDVPHNTAIRNPQPSMMILWGLVSFIIVTGALALIRSSRRTAVASFVASGLGMLFSHMLACV